MTDNKNIEGLSAAIMNLPCEVPAGWSDQAAVMSDGYRRGHRDARHSAAALASEVAALLEAAPAAQRYALNPDNGLMYESSRGPWVRFVDTLFEPPTVADKEAWQPIATAPKDGTPVLVCNDERKGCWIAHYQPVYGSGYRPPNPWSSLMLNCDWHKDRWSSYVPTRWMPLPLPAAPGAEPQQPNAHLALPESSAAPEIGAEAAPSIGDYVLATKYQDGDPGDAWALGFYDGVHDEQGRHYVIDSSGKQIRGNGYRRVARIRGDVGRWLLEVAADQLERSPPGTVNLWTMLTPAAFDLDNDREANRDAAPSAAAPAQRRDLALAAECVIGIEDPDMTQDEHERIAKTLRDMAAAPAQEGQEPVAFVPVYGMSIPWPHWEETVPANKRDSLTRLPTMALYTAPQDAALRESHARLVEALTLVLPLAKGYAHAHPVGSNGERVQDAEYALERAKKEQPHD